MILNITTWANSDHTKKVCITDRSGTTYYSIHSTSDQNGITIDEAKEYIQANNLQRIDTITIEFPITI